MHSPTCTSPPYTSTSQSPSHWLVVRRWPPYTSTSQSPSHWLVVRRWTVTWRPCIGPGTQVTWHKITQRYACFVNEIFHTSIARLYIQTKACYDHTMIVIFMTMLKTRWHRYGGVAQASLYQLPSCWITRVFMASAKRGGITDWMFTWGWRNITYGYEKVCCKEGIFLYIFNEPTLPY